MNQKSMLSIINNIEELVQDQELVNDAILEVTIEEYEDGDTENAVLEFIHVIQGKNTSFSSMIDFPYLDMDDIDKVYSNIKEEAFRRSII